MADYVRDCAVPALHQCKKKPQQNELSAMAEKKKMVHGLLDFKANWREFCDHSYFRDWTSYQRRLRK